MDLTLPPDAGACCQTVDGWVLFGPESRGVPVRLESGPGMLSSMEMQWPVGADPRHFPSQDTGCSELWCFWETGGGQASVLGSSRNEPGA